jgi:MerR family mercuric resistance operon transcriptional regulator
LRGRHFHIGGLSARTGVNIETIRYYERIGVVPAPPRTEGRQRVYDQDHLKRLTFIRRGRELGFSLDEIRELLGLVRGHGLTCAEVKAMTEEHVAGIRAKVRDLKKLERVLNELAAQCHGKEVPDCPVLDALGGGDFPRKMPVRDSDPVGRPIGFPMTRKVPLSDRKGSQPERVVSIRIIMIEPPPGVAMCLRSKDDEMVDRIIASGDDLSFDFAVLARRANDSHALRLLGPFVYGPPAQRFVFIRVGTLAGQPDSCWTRAAKIPLSGITWRMIERTGRGAAKLVAKVNGRAKDGGPLCASIQLLDGGWRVAS